MEQAAEGNQTVETEIQQDLGQKEQPDAEEEEEEITDTGQAPQESAEEDSQEPGDINEQDNIQGIQPPSVQLQIIEGPSYAQGGNICYYRVSATVSGNPEPVLSFSKDDSNGAWGRSITQVNLSGGQSYVLEAVAENEAGSVTASITLGWVDQKDSSQEQIDYTDSQQFRIDVSLAEQKVMVYYQGNLLREMPCSGGTPQGPTPVGTFKTSQKIYYSWLPKYDVGAYYFIRFYGSYLFHSLPFDKDGNLIQEEAEKLGLPASHGCIRLKVEDARWLYETLPLGVEVNIY